MNTKTEMKHTQEIEVFRTKEAVKKLCRLLTRKDSWNLTDNEIIESLEEIIDYLEGEID